MKVEVTFQVTVTDPILLHKRLREILIDSGAGPEVDIEDKTPAGHAALLLDTILSGQWDPMPSPSTCGITIDDSSGVEIQE